MAGAPRALNFQDFLQDSPVLDRTGSSFDIFTENMLYKLKS